MAPPPRCPQRGHQRPQPEHDAVDVDAHDAAVLLVGEVFDGDLAGGYACIEVGKVDAAELGRHLLHDHGPRGGIAHVRLDVGVSDAGRRGLQVNDGATGAPDVRRCTVASPMPDEPPVTSASLPANSPSAMAQ